MLLRTLFVLMLLATLTETIVHGVHALAQAALHRQALVAVHDQLDASATAAREAIAQAIAAGADPRAPGPVPPSPAVICRLRAQRGCAIEGVSLTAFATPLPASPSPCPDGACTVYEQDNDVVDEGRVDATIAASAIAPDGTMLATRAQRYTFRTLGVAPYAVPAGQVDASVEIPGGSGDDGGAVPNGAAPGTLVDVLYENAATGATLPANVWRPQVESLDAKSPAWSP